MDTWTAIERVGFPIVVIMMFFFAGWKILRWLGSNVISPITASHIALVNEVKAASSTNSTALTKVTELFEVKSKALTVMAKQNQQVIRLTVDSNEKLDGIASAIPLQTKELVVHLEKLSTELKK